MGNNLNNLQVLQVLHSDFTKGVSSIKRKVLSNIKELHDSESLHNTHYHLPVECACESCIG